MSCCTNSTGDGTRRRALRDDVIGGLVDASDVSSTASIRDIDVIKPPEPVAMAASDSECAVAVGAFSTEAGEPAVVVAAMGDAEGLR